MLVSWEYVVPMGQSMLTPILSMPQGPVVTLQVMQALLPGAAYCVAVQAVAEVEALAAQDLPTGHTVQPLSTLTSD